MSWLISSSFNQEHYDITMYCLQIFLKMLLALIIYPLFKIGLEQIFKTHTYAEGPGQEPVELNQQNWGYGFYECCLFLSASILTSMIVNQIQFGTIYPFF
jgi:hypothetical protein